MASGTYKTIVLAERPKDSIVPGETFRLESKPRPTEADLEDGDVLIEALYLSVDPAMRGWLKGISCLVVVSSDMVHFVSSLDIAKGKGASLKLVHLQIDAPISLPYP